MLDIGKVRVVVRLAVFMVVDMVLVIAMVRLVVLMVSNMVQRPKKSALSDDFDKLL